MKKAPSQRGLSPEGDWGSDSLRLPFGQPPPSKREALGEK